MSEKLITYGEAARIFADAGISEATLRRRIEKGVIQAMKGRRRNDPKYPEDQVIAATTMKHYQRVEHPSGVTDWVKDSDLPYLLKLDYRLYGEYTVSAEITQHWWRKNPTGCRIIFNERDREDVWGAISVIPMEEATAIKLVTGQMEEKELTADDVLSYEDEGVYTAYVPSAAIHPEHKASLLKLMNSVVDFWCEQYPQVQLTKLYAFASSDEGLELMKYLFFSPRYDLGESVFELDPYRPNPSPIVKRFQRCIAA